MTDREQRIIAMRKSGMTIDQIRLEVHARRSTIRDALAKAQAITGEFIPQVMCGRKPKLSAAQRAEILASDEKAAVLAVLNNVSSELINCIRRGQVLKTHRRESAPLLPE